MEMLILLPALCLLMSVSPVLAREPRDRARATPEPDLGPGEAEPELDRFLTVDEELAQIALLPITDFERLVPEVERFQTEELKIVQALTGTQILKNDGNFHLELLAPSVSIELDGTRLNVQMTAEEKIAKEAELVDYLHGQSLEQRLAVWGHQANISALLTAHRTSQALKLEAFDIRRDDLFEFDIVLDLYDVLELEEDIVDQIQDGVFPKDLNVLPPELITLTPLPPAGLFASRDAGSLGPGVPDEKPGNVGVGRHRMKRKMRNSKKWNLPIKYKFKNTMTATERSAIRRAINYWASLTCISFSYSPRVRWPTSRIVFRKTTRTTSCGSSPVGKRGFGFKNQIDIACFDQGTIVHEIGHSLGFYHEQSRPDRDTYVNVHWANIPSSAHHNFCKRNALTYSIPYDYYSIMHYSSVVWDVVALTAKDDNYTPLMGQRTELTFYDVKLANFHYCSTKCSPYASLVWSSCKNQGYRNPKNCGQCRCAPGFKGKYCTGLETHGTLECGASQPVASPTTQYIQSPNYGTARSNHYQQNDKCVWLIHAPSGGRVIAWFLSLFRLRGSSRCNTDSVEVRYGAVASPGPKYCGSTSPGITFTSTNSKLMVLFESTGATSTAYKGFKLAYKTQACGLCDFSYSPSPACRHIVSYAKESVYYTRCGWWGKRCKRRRYSLAYKYQNTCCHGHVVGSQCQVFGCGGCSDTLVKSQPRCVRHARSKYITETYYIRCGWWGRRRCNRTRQKLVYYWHTPPPCCNGFTLVGSRCIK